jgi:hypothetical protein
MIAPTNMSQGDTISFYDCVFSQNGIGVDIGRFHNFNAISIGFYGGNFIANGTGINSNYGTLSQVIGTLFEVSSKWDILIPGGAWQNVLIQGVSTESPNFVSCRHSIPKIVGCNQRSNNGIFLHSGTFGAIESCVSVGGQVRFEVGGSIRDSQFQRSDAVYSDPEYPKPVYVENCMIGGTWWGDGQGSYNMVEPNYVKGFFQFFVATNQQHFVGTKRPTTVTVIGGPSRVTTFQKFADLPPASLVKGTETVIDDSPTNTLGANIASGGGTFVVKAFSNGAAWTVSAK